MDHNKKDRKDTGLKGVEWIHLAQDRTSGCSYKHGNDASGSVKDG
jgi:hypothetical protein